MDIELHDTFLLPCGHCGVIISTLELGFHDLKFWVFCKDCNRSYDYRLTLNEIFDYKPTKLLGEVSNGNAPGGTWLRHKTV